MAAQHSQGIQTLLEAEKDAAKIVQRAREYRLQRLKDARSEASREIEEYRQATEAEFKAFEASHAGVTSNAQTAVDKETEVKLQALADAYQAHRDVVVKKVLDRLLLIKPQLHRNVKNVGGTEPQSNL